MTPQRQAVLDALAECGGHPTAAEIYERVQQRRPGLAYATVYNALNALAERGFDVFGASRRPLEPGTGLRWIAMDVRSDASVERGVREAQAIAGRLDALVCCAGYGIFGSIEETPIETARQQFETNVFGVLRVLRAVVPGMREARRGRIAVVGSLAGRAPIPFQAHYSASKAALDALTLALRAELHPFGVGVSLIEPGDISTPFNDAMDWGDPGASAYGERARSAERATRELLLDILRKEGVVPVGIAAGDPFDPEFQEAIETREGPVDEARVAEVRSTGYTFEGRVLRPARVVVLQPSASPTDKPH